MYEKIIIDELTTSIHPLSLIKEFKLINTDMILDNLSRLIKSRRDELNLWIFKISFYSYDVPQREIDDDELFDLIVQKYFGVIIIKSSDEINDFNCNLKNERLICKKIYFIPAKSLLEIADRVLCTNKNLDNRYIMLDIKDAFKSSQKKELNLFAS